jgi:hypothetical protein
MKILQTARERRFSTIDRERARVCITLPIDTEPCVHEPFCKIQ